MSTSSRRICAGLLASAVCLGFSGPAHATIPPTGPSVSRTGPGWFTDPLGPARRRTLVAVPRVPGRYDGGTRRYTRALHRTLDGTLAVPVTRARGHRLGMGQAAWLQVPRGYPRAHLSAAAVRQLRWLRVATAGAADLSCEGYAGYGRHATRSGTPVSRQRAAAVCRLLVRGRDGVTFAATGYGDSRPVVVGGAFARRETLRAANRRVVVVVTGVDSLPSAPALLNAGYFDGSEAHLYWDAPDRDGDSPVTGYQVSTDDGPWAATGTATQATVPVPNPRCAAPTPHVFAVRAIEADGPGSASDPLTLPVAGPAGSASTTVNARVRCR